MRKYIRLPRILKINYINGLTISVVFNNGESRIIDFNKILKYAKNKKEYPEHILLDKEEFAKVELVDHTLSWSNVEQYITSIQGEEVRVPYDIGADTLYEYSEADLQHNVYLGKMLKKARISQSLTQEDLAKRSGTTRNYISRIENDRSDLEVATLRKIVEVGLEKRLEISIK